MSLDARTPHCTPGSGLQTCVPFSCLSRGAWTEVHTSLPPGSLLSQGEQELSAGSSQEWPDERWAGVVSADPSKCGSIWGATQKVDWAAEASRDAVQPNRVVPLLDPGSLPLLTLRSALGRASRQTPGVSGDLSCWVCVCLLNWIHSLISLV